MKKSNLIKTVLILIIAMVMVASFITVANADDNGYKDMTNTLTNTSTTPENNANTNANTANVNNSALVTNNTSNTNNSSTYNTTDLPKTGIENSIPVAMLIVIFGISAIFAYKKIKEYKNI